MAEAYDVWLRQQLPRRLAGLRGYLGGVTGPRRRQPICVFVLVLCFAGNLANDLIHCVRFAHFVRVNCFASFFFVNENAICT